MPLAITTINLSTTFVRNYLFHRDAFKLIFLLSKFSLQEKGAIYPVQKNETDRVP